MSKTSSPHDDADIGTPTGVPELDAALGGGLRRGQLAVLGGATLSGKTALASQIALSAARWAGGHSRGDVLYFSLDMNAQALTIRLLLASTPNLQDSYRIPGGWSERDRPLIAATAAKINALPLVIQGSCGATLDAIADFIQNDLDWMGRSPSLIVIDDVGLVLPAVSQQGRSGAMRSVSRGLKKLAYELDAPVLALCQCNRQMNTGIVRPPALTDLRCSIALEQDADLIALLHAPYLYLTDYEDRSRLITSGAPVSLAIFKNRRGAPADIALEWFGPRLSFRTPAKNQA